MIQMIMHSSQILSDGQRTSSLCSQCLHACGKPPTGIYTVSSPHFTQSSLVLIFSLVAESTPECLLAQPNND